MVNPLPFAGGNRAGWSNAGYDRLWPAYSTTLDRADRNRQIVQMTKLVSEELPVNMLYFNIGVTAHVRGLRGPEVGTPETLGFWNIREWEIR